MTIQRPSSIYVVYMSVWPARRPQAAPFNPVSIAWPPAMIDGSS